ncbi:MAG: M3 family metallopeptidase [Candidatus Sericytochromatia bacterium]|nr:M3 family metallopeptidase [Candidatus Sericytochromatia bacterium]
MSVAPRDDLSSWDLTPYYTGPDDPRIDADLATVREQVKAFRAQYLGRLHALAPAELRAAFETYDAIGSGLSDLSDYGFLSYCLDTRSVPAQSLDSKLQGEAASIRGDTTFFSHELQHLPESAFEALCGAPELAPWRDHLRRLRRHAPHALSHEIERVIARKDRSGVQAWRQLYNTMVSSLSIPVETEGEIKRVTAAEAHRMGTSADRALRRSAAQASMTALSDSKHVITAVFNAVLEDSRVNADLRGFELPYADMLRDEDLDAPAVESLLSAVESRYDLVHRYMRLKARALGIEDFSHWDINAPVADEPMHFSFDEARRVVHDTYTAFHPRVGRLIDQFFQGYVDAAPTPGKWSGAFCSWSSPGRHPYVLMSYTNRIRDVLTLAHELGHGVHYRITADHDRYMNLRVNLFNETPSTLGELLTFERLVAEAPNAATRRTLLGAWLDTTVGTLFLQAALTRWEQKIHARRRQAPLTAEAIGSAWMAERRALFGPDVHLPDWVSLGWMSHQHAVGMPFYCINYTFGLTLVYALRQRWREEGPKFADDFVGLLEAGLAPGIADLLRRIQVDVHDMSFWQSGLKAVEALIDEFEASL